MDDDAVDASPEPLGSPLAPAGSARGVSDGPSPEGRSPGDFVPIFESAAMELIDITRARHEVMARLFDSQYSGDIGDVALALSELVTNAVIHAGGATKITVSCAANRIRIEVQDDDPRRPYQRVDRGEPGGLGLVIVEDLSERWGSRSIATGKVVWAVMPAGR